MKGRHLLTLVLPLLLLGAALPASAATVNVSIQSGGGGFNPQTVNITAGDTVVWTNNDNQTRNVSSNNHPVHDLYPALNLGDVAPSGTLSLAFPAAGTYGYHDHLFSGNIGTIVVAAAPSGSSGASASSVVPPSASVSRPNGGETLASGVDDLILWTAGGTELRGIRILLSTDGGATFPTTVATNVYHNGAYYWKVPDMQTTATARIRIQVLGAGDSVLASDDSDKDFEIRGAPAAAATPTSSGSSTETTTPTAAEPPPGTETTGAPAPETAAPRATTTGAYVPATAAAAVTSVDEDKEIAEIPEPQRKCAAGSLIKGSRPFVYYCGRNGKRYVFPSEKVFYTWYKDFKAVITMDDAALAAIPLGGNVTYKPGVRMVKIATDPKVYAIAPGGILRWVKDETVAAKLYGMRWNRNIDTVSDSLFVDYRLGDPIVE